MLGINEGADVLKEIYNKSTLKSEEFGRSGQSSCRNNPWYSHQNFHAPLKTRYYI
jgi:hypothetical protein